MCYFLYTLFKGILGDDKLEYIMFLQYGMLLLGSFNHKPVFIAIIAEAKTFSVNILWNLLSSVYLAGL
jgi:hypothetical protein